MTLLAETAPVAPVISFAPEKPRRRRRRVLIAVGIVMLLVLVALGAGAAYANASLSATYSPQRAVTDYLAAQKRGDAASMFANATYLRGDGALNQEFDLTAVQQMLKTPQNSDIQGVKITSSKVVDDSTQWITASMTWSGKQRSQTYVVHKDRTRVHDFFYYSWRIDVPYVTIGVKLPNQAGQIGLDGVLLPPGTELAGIQAIQGFHTVSMYSTFLYDSSSQMVDAVETHPTATFPSTLSAAAVKAAASAIKASFGVCDPSKFDSCLNHTYSAPNDPTYIYFFDVPGTGEVQYSTYSFALVGDPTANMTLVVGADAGKLSASGACTVTLTLDGNKSYNLKGDWAATLTISLNSFVAGLSVDCYKAAA